MIQLNQLANSNSQTTQTLPITPESHPATWQLLQPPAQPAQPPQNPTPVPEGWDKV